jgi:hypothetical protein
MKNSRKSFDWNTISFFFSFKLNEFWWNFKCFEMRSKTQLNDTKFGRILLIESTYNEQSVWMFSSRSFVEFVKKI